MKSDVLLSFEIGFVCIKSRDHGMMDDLLLDSLNIITSIELIAIRHIY